MPFWDPHLDATKASVEVIPAGRKVGAQRATTEPQYPGRRNIPYSGQTAAGVYIDPDRALMNDTVWAAHRYLTQTVAQLPALVQRVTASGDIEQVASHPVDSVLNWRVNPEMSPFGFRETMVGWAIMHGNGVAEIETDLVGRVVNLWPIEPHRLRFERAVEPIVDAKGTPIAPGELAYLIRNVDGSVVLSSRNVFHLRGYGNGPVGISVIEYAAQSIGWARATELFGAAYFGNGLNAGGFIEGADGMDDDDIERLEARIDERHGGPGKAHRPLILDGGLKWNKTTATPDEAQFVSTLQHQVETICRWIGAPPHKVYHLLRMTFNNVEQLSIDVVGDCIVPWANRLEQEATFKLFGQNRSGFKVYFDVNELLRGDFLSRQNGLQIMRRNGVINADDWARREGMKKPGKAAGGDIYIVEGNMTRLDQVGQTEIAEPAAAAALERSRRWRQEFVDAR